MKVKIKGKVDILAIFPIDTSLKKKTHSAVRLVTQVFFSSSHFDFLRIFKYKKYHPERLPHLFCEMQEGI